MTRKKYYTIPLQLIELEDDNYHILIETEFHNGEKGKWAIDTGASKTVFDINQKQFFEFSEVGNTEIRSAGLGEAQIDTMAGLLPLVKLGALQLDNWPVAIIDMQFVNKLYSQFTNEIIVGLLGSDFLVQHRAIIDFKKLTLKIYF